MPNLFSAFPVAILACVLGSTSGLTRIEISAVRPLAVAIEERSASSDSDSTLMQRMPCSTARLSSRAILPTPENTMRCGGMPAARARKSSPSETTSAPAPSRQRGDDRLVGIRLQCVTNKRIDIGEGSGEDIVVPLDRGAAIAIER